MSLDKKKVVVIRGGTLDRETRATKIIKSLTDKGFLVTLISWNQGFSPPRSERREAGKFHNEIQLKLKTKWGLSVYIALPIWWAFVFFSLMRTEWDVAHAIQITSVFPTIIAGKLKRKPVIYDMLDVYEDSIQIPKRARDFIIIIDKALMRLSSCVILADIEQIEEVGGIPNSDVIAIYDSPHTISDIDLNHEQNEIFTLFFAGLLMRKKALNLDKIFEAIHNIEGVKIVIAGYGDLVDDINELSHNMNGKIEFIGEIGRAEVLERSAKADLLFILRDPIVLVNKYICGSKVLEAMMCGTPILVNRGTSTANKVLEEKCGVAVDANNIEEIRDAIIKLRDNPKLCKKLGENGRRAYDERYSWEIMENRLIECYNKLMTQREGDCRTKCVK